MGMANPFLTAHIKYLRAYHILVEEFDKFVRNLEAGDLVIYYEYGALFSEIRKMVEEINPKITIEYINPGSLAYARTQTAFSFLVIDRKQDETNIKRVKKIETFLFDENELVVEWIRTNKK